MHIDDKNFMGNAQNQFKIYDFITYVKTNRILSIKHRSLGGTLKEKQRNNNKCSFNFGKDVSFKNMNEHCTNSRTTCKISFPISNIYILISIKINISRNQLVSFES